MPCWQVNRIVYEKISIKPDLAVKTVAELSNWFESKLSGRYRSLKVALINSEIIVADRYGDRLYTANITTGEVAYQRGYEELHNALKRAYSMAVVQKVANKSQVSRQFKMKQTSSRSVVLQRR